MTQPKQQERERRLPVCNLGGFTLIYGVVYTRFDLNESSAEGCLVQTNAGVAVGTVGFLRRASALAPAK